MNQCLLSVFLDRQKTPMCLPKSPQITRFPLCSLTSHRIRCCNINIVNRCLLSMFFDRKKAPMHFQKNPQITRFRQGSSVLSESASRRPVDWQAPSKFFDLTKKPCLGSARMPLFAHCVIRVLGSVAGLGAHAPLR